MYDSNLEYQQNIDYPGTILFIIFIIAFIIGSLFVNLFATTYETLLICYLVGLKLESKYSAKMNWNQEEIIHGLKEIELYQELNEKN